jgi:hypothetical protein
MYIYVHIKKIVTNFNITTSPDFSLPSQTGQKLSKTGQKLSKTGHIKEKTGHIKEKTGHLPGNRVTLVGAQQVAWQRPPAFHSKTTRVGNKKRKNCK